MNKLFFDEIHNERKQVDKAYPNSDYGRGIHEGLRVACIIAKQTAKLPDKLLNFMCYLVDNCEGEIITEEFLLKVGNEFIAGKQ